MRVRGLLWLLLTAAPAAGCFVAFDPALLGDGGTGQDGAADTGTDGAPPGPCSCTSPACTQECSRSLSIDGCDCDAHCQSGPCDIECASSSTCSFDCQGQSCEASVADSTLSATCGGGSSCDVTCTQGSTCSLECRGSDCELDCDPSSSCSFTFCTGGETECPDGRLLCRRDC